MSAFQWKIDSNMMKTQLADCEDRTPRRTHIFLSLVSVPHSIALFTRTCVRVAQARDMIGTCCVPARLL